MSTMTKVPPHRPCRSFTEEFKANRRPLVLYTGLLGLPGSGAAIEHALNVAKTLEAAGYNALLLPWAEDGRPEDRLPSGLFCCQGIHYLPVGNPSTDGSSRLESLKVYTGARSPVLRMLHGSDLAGVTAIITMEGSAGFSWKLRSLCRSRGIKLIGEVTEWYAATSWLQSSSVIERIDQEARLRTVYPTYDGIIAITSCLEDYYSRRGCKVLRLPPVLDTGAVRWSRPLRDEAPRAGLRLVFSGTPGRDRQDVILNAILQSRGQGRDVSIEYVGCSRESVLASLGRCPNLLNTLGDAVVCHGRVGEEQLRSIMASADFGILLREEAPWSRSCFPSKVPEFLSLGVPIICNLTGDLGTYLDDAKEALIAPDTSVTALGKTLARAIDLSPSQKKQMQQYSRLKAESHFDIRRHANLLGGFIRKIAQ